MWGPKTERRQAVQKWVGDKKVPVFGMVERKGNVAAYVVPSIRTATLKPHMDRHVAPGTKLMTDDGKSYRGLKRAGWDHEVVNHSARIYVSGNVHTNTIEGFWSLVKRGISGTHHSVSPSGCRGT